jgi:hypothetical protein
MSTATGTNIDSVRTCQWAARLNQVVKMHGVRNIGRGAALVQLPISNRPRCPC